MYRPHVGEEPEAITPSLKGSIMTSFESVPTTWDDLRDGSFFRIVSHVLDGRLLEAASCLLAANDGELAPST
jgi:hypothetical protein